LPAPDLSIKELRIGHKKNERSIFGKTNPIRADESSIKVRRVDRLGGEAVVIDVRRSNDAAVENTIAGAAHSVGRWPANRRPPDTTRKHARSQEKERYGLNMCRQSIVDAPLDLKRELEEFDRTKDQSVLIKAVIDQLLITRYDSATLVAKTKLVALEILIERMHVD
jgi:hypothetical protein